MPIWHRFESLKHSSAPPFAFTEYGVVMLASVLNSQRAVRISVRIAETFIRLRQMVASQAQLMKKLSELEGRLDQHDGAIRGIIDVIRKMMAPPEEPRPNIGFQPRQS